MTKAKVLEKLAYSPETGEFTWLTTWAKGRVAGHIDHLGPSKLPYRRIRIDGRLLLAHHLVLLVNDIPIPAGMEVDHIDGDGLNNRLSNLRVVSRAENMKNKGSYPRKTPGRTGVHQLPSGSWIACIGAGGKLVWSVACETYDEAVGKRVDMERQYGYAPNNRR